MKWNVGDKKSFIHNFTEQDVNQFISLTGDSNPIHTNESFAKSHYLGDKVVHGMLAATYISKLVGEQIPGKGALWKSFSLDWIIPIRIGDKITFEVEVIKIYKSTGMMDLKVYGKDCHSKEIKLEGNATVFNLTKNVSKNKVETKNKVVLLTGSTGSVGRAICEKLVEKNYKLILLARDKDKLNKLAKVYKKDCLHSICVDLTNLNQLMKQLEEIPNFINIVGFVHAASLPIAKIKCSHPSQIDHTNNHNLVTSQSFQAICSYLVPKFVNGGSIISILTNIISGSPPENMSSYVAAKSALWGLTKSFAIELGPKGIRSNAISPGMINTSYTLDISPKEKQIEALKTPLRRLCNECDVANVVSFLLSEQSAFINGANIPLNGGINIVN